MSGPGDVIAGMAPPQDNAPARNPEGWPYRQAARADEAEERAEREGRGRRRKRRGGRDAAGGEQGRGSGGGGEGEQLREAVEGKPYRSVRKDEGGAFAAGVDGGGGMVDEAGRGGWAERAAAESGEDGRGTGDGDSGSGAEGAQERHGRESLNALAGYIRSSWARNKRARDVVEHRLLACLRARRGVYAQAELAEMWTADAGEPIYLPLAATKMRAAEAALRELLLPDGERPWGLQATPIPDLPPEVSAPIEAHAALLARQEMQLAAARGGKALTLEQFAAMAARLQGELRDRVLEDSRKEAELRAGRMEDVIEEKMQRGGYYKALAEFVQNFCTYPAAVLKGPFLRRGKRLEWLRPGEPDVVSAPELSWAAVSPFDCYPAPEAESCQDGDFIERIRMTRADLYECIGTPGYSETAIRSVLAQHQSGGLRAWLWNDAERRMLEGETHDVWIPDYLVDALHFWGSVEGRVLLEYGLTQGVGDPLAYYEVDAVLIGSEVIRCEINDDPLGRRPYHNASYDPVPGAFWGNSIYELMRDCQAMVNACARAMNANLGLASGPIMGIDMSQLAAGQDPKMLRPLQIIQLDRSRAQAASAPIEWYQADSRAAELLSIIEKFEQKADDLTGIPRYMYGNESMDGAGATASGLSMLMGTAAKGLQRAVATIDRGVIARTVEAAYVHEMLYNPDESLKGDCAVSARGTAALLIKEHLQQTRTQFLALTANPIDMQIIGLKGRRAVLAEVVKALAMPVDEILPSEQELEAQISQQQQPKPPQPTPNAVLKAAGEKAKVDAQERIAGARIAGQLAKERLRKGEDIGTSGDGFLPQAGSGSSGGPALSGEAVEGQWPAAAPQAQE